MGTKVICIRHGKTENSGYAEDFLRPLSEEGKSIQKNVTQKISDRGYLPDQILTSPLLRAQQTAQVVANTFQVSSQNEEALGYDFNTEILISKIPPSDSNQTIFFIGHAPTLANFVNQLIGKNALPNGLSKSEAAVIEFTDEIAFGKGKLLETISP